MGFLWVLLYCYRLRLQKKRISSCFVLWLSNIQAELINNNRDYLASIDVEDLPPTLNPPAFSPATQPSHPPAHLPTLHCTLYLFSDRILIGKRPSAGASGRKLTGLDDVARLWKGSVGPSSVPSVARKSEGEGRMGCKGLVGLLDLVVCDSGGGGMFFFSFFFVLENPITGGVDLRVGV